MTFLFIHGTFESPNNAWFPWLKNELQKMGHIVIAPQFPVDKWSEISKQPVSEYAPTQQLGAWFDVFEKIRNTIKPDTKLCIVAHSLGPVFTLLVAQKYSMQLANAYFIAPFFEVYGKSDYIEKANDSFYHQQFDFPKLRRLIPNSTVLYSDNDPYIDKLKSVEFREKLKSKIVRLHGLGHMGSESGMKDFPQLLDLIKQDSNIITRHDKSIR